MKHAVSAAVVAGGASSRMGGAPKGLLEYEGTRFLTRIVNTLAEISDDLICVTCRPEEYRFEEKRLRFVADYGGHPQGPLSGILGALAAAHNPLCVVVAVDMPFLNLEVLRYLVDQAGDADAAVPIIFGDRPESLHAVYRTTLIPAGVAALEAGQLKVREFLRSVSTRYVPAEEFRSLDPDLRSFENINTPEQLAHALSRVVKRGGKC